MSISPAQIREARRLLRRSSSWLSNRSYVAFHRVVAAQRDDTAAAIDLAQVRAMRGVLEAAGVEFVDPQDGGAGVRLKARAS